MSDTPGDSEDEDEDFDAIVRRQEPRPKQKKAVKAAVEADSLVKGSLWTKLPASEYVGQDILNACLKNDKQNPLLTPSEKGYVTAPANNRVNVIVTCNKANKDCRYKVIARFRGEGRDAAEITTCCLEHDATCEPRKRNVKVQRSFFFLSQLALN